MRGLYKGVLRGVFSEVVTVEEVAHTVHTDTTPHTIIRVTNKQRLL